MSYPLRLLPVFLALALVSAGAQSPTTSKAAPATAEPPAHAAADPDAVRQQELETALETDEPGAQMRQLEAFLKQHPGAPETADVYGAIIKDATALADSRRVLQYNIKLQELDPADIGQRITTLNLLLLETDPDSRALAASYAHDLALAVEAKAHESAADEATVSSPAAYDADLNRMRALATLFEGSAAQALGRYAAAETYLVDSLHYAQSEQAAEHLAAVYVAEDKLPQALNTYALALALPGDSVAERAALRAQAGDLYKRLHPDAAPPSLGDMILSQFDAVAARDASEEKALSPDPAQRNRSARGPGDFSLMGLDGATHRLSDAFARHQVVVVVFWSVHGGVPAGMAQLRAEPEIAHDVMFISIDEDAGIGADALEAARTAHPELGAPAAVWRDAGLADYLNIDELPAVLVFDRGGNMMYRREGLDADAAPEGFPADLVSAVTTALTGDGQ